uniref:Brain and acute leukemia cytoplasmic protein n=1 Tax=Chelydra serpentina TaxID=8475 RepID=A0A8C3S346_CHESE
MGCGGSRADAIEPRYYESWTRETESTWLTNTDTEPPPPACGHESARAEAGLINDHAKQGIEKYILKVAQISLPSLNPHENKIPWTMTLQKMKLTQQCEIRQLAYNVTFYF